MRWSRAVHVAAAAAVVLSGRLAVAETIWTDASHTHVKWISEETLRATLDPETLEPLSDEADALSVAEAAELKSRLKHFQNTYDKGLGSRFRGEAQECPAEIDPCGFGLLPGEVAKPLAELILEKNEGFAVVVKVEGVEPGWSPQWNMPTKMVTVRTVRTLWSSPNLAAAPTSFRFLESGDWLDVHGLRICWSLKNDFFDPRPGELIFVWGNLGPEIPDLLAPGHKLTVTDDTIDSRCAYCTTQMGLSLDLLQEQLQVGARR